MADCSSAGCSLRVPRENVPAIAARLLQELPVTDIAIEETSAEEVIRRLFMDGTGYADGEEAGTP